MQNTVSVFEEALTCKLDRFRQAFLADALQALEDADGDIAEAKARLRLPEGQGEALAWLSSHPGRYKYVDRWRAECGASDSILHDIDGGWMTEAVEVLDTVVEALRQKDAAEGASS